MMSIRMMTTTRVATLVRRSTRNGRRRRHRLGREWHSRSPPQRPKKRKKGRVDACSLPGLKSSPVSATSPPQRKGPSTPPIVSRPSRNSTPCPAKEEGRSSKSHGDGRVSKKGRGGHRTSRGWWRARGNGRRGTRSCVGRRRRAGEARTGRRKWRRRRRRRRRRSRIREAQEGWRVPRDPAQLQLGGGLYCPPRPRLRARRPSTRNLSSTSPRLL